MNGVLFVLGLVALALVPIAFGALCSSSDADVWDERQRIERERVRGPYDFEEDRSLDVGSATIDRAGVVLPLPATPRCSASVVADRAPSASGPHPIQVGRATGRLLPAYQAGGAPGPGERSHG